MGFKGAVSFAILDAITIIVLYFFFLLIEPNQFKTFESIFVIVVFSSITIMSPIMVYLEFKDEYAKNVQTLKIYTWQSERYEQNLEKLAQDVEGGGVYRIDEEDAGKKH